MAKSKNTSSIHEAAKIIGAQGGKKGGPARAKALPHGRRVEIARKGGKAAHGKKN